MKITDLLKPESIALGVSAQNKQDAIDKLVALMEKAGNVKDAKAYKEGVLRREEEGTTGVGEGVAIPHAKTAAVTKPGLAAMTVPDGVDYESLDGLPTNLFFLIAAPDTEENVHLDVLGRLSVMLMNDAFRADLLAAKDAKTFLDIIDKAEQEKFAEEDAAKAETAPQKTGYRVLAVTACPTGIAHTYMAAEALEGAAQKMGVTIKVETDGSGGAKNVLTKEEIEQCDCIIVAADKNVEMARFDGKPVISVGVSAAISRPKELLEKALSGKVAPYQSDHKAADRNDDMEKEGVGRQIYKHLMNGVSHMLPFVIGGGILIALSFLLDSGAAGTADFGSSTPLAAFFNTVGNFAFSMMMPILAGFIAMSIGDRPALMLGIVGGLIANEGGSGFFGALIAGFLAGYIIVLLGKVFEKLPKSVEGIKPVLLYPFLGILLIGVLMTYVVNPPMAWFNTWLANALESMGGTSKVLLGIVLGGMMSIDFGGPVNKAAYVFGTASIATGQYDIMAAVMVGGMVPPIAIAICSLLFRRKFTKKERQSGVTNFIMGLSFITEGAIPFAASDPLRVIPACAIGSAIAGGLSMLLGCELMAPHGGIFVFGIVNHPLNYLIALVVGSIVGAVLLGLLKRKVTE